MKCKYCDGTGTTNWCVNGTFLNCPHCGGTGEVEQTNEEWFCGLSTEEKARLLVSNKLFFRMLDYDGFVEWLKQPHTTKE